MAKQKRKTVKKRSSMSAAEAALDRYEGVFALKLVLYLILGSMWLKVSSGQTTIPLPVGLIVGMIFLSHEHFRLDRKIGYAVLLVAAFMGFLAPFGLYLSL